MTGTTTLVTADQEATMGILPVAATDPAPAPSPGTGAVPPREPVIPLDLVVDVDPRVARAVDLLHRRAGDPAVDLPATLGRAVLRCEALLAAGPTALDPVTADPLSVILTTDQLLRSAGVVVGLVIEEAQILGEALSADLASLSLDELHSLAEVVLELSTSPRAAAIWGDPAEAEAAATVLQVAADDLRSSAAAHARIYRRYTEYVWDIPGPLLLAAQRRWHVIARARLRRQLRAVSRTDRFPRSLTAAAREVAEVRDLRAQLASMSSLLSHHLAELEQGPLTDVDAALLALGAVRHLQAAMGDLLDPARLQQLLRADAFASPDVVTPALTLRNAVLAWRHDLAVAGLDDGCALTGDALAAWVAECTDLLPALREGQAAAARLGIGAPTLRSLVEMLMLREHIDDLLVGGRRTDAAGRQDRTEVGS